jgi:hypothetical protein
MLCRHIILGFTALLIFSTEANPEDDGGTGFHKLLQAATRPHAHSSRGASIAGLEMQVRANRLYRVAIDDGVADADIAADIQRNADLLSAMANFDCDDSNTVRFAEFANGFRRFRSSRQKMQGRSVITRSRSKGSGRVAVWALLHAVCAPTRHPTPIPAAITHHTPSESTH